MTHSPGSPADENDALNEAPPTGDNADVYLFANK